MASQINPSMTYYQPNPAAAKKRKIGAMMAGALIGMNAYYLPVNKDLFVQRAIDIAKEKTNAQIAVLAKIAKEVDNKSVTTESKMILQEMGLSQDVKAITQKCIELDKKINDKTSVKNLKDDFVKNFDTFKKNPSLMDNTSNEAFRGVKRTKFKWGAGIGAAIGLALGLLTSRE